MLSSKQINTNKVEALLEWKFNLDQQVIQVNYLPTQEQEVLLQTFHKVKITKSVAGQNLSALAEDVRAIFINIDWGKKGQTIKDMQQLKI